MIQKHTEQEWLKLIQDCRNSSMTVKDWCSQHDLTVKALYYHTYQLRKKGYTIPNKTITSDRCEKHEIVCLDITMRSALEMHITFSLLKDMTFNRSVFVFNYYM